MRLANIIFVIAFAIVCCDARKRSRSTCREPVIFQNLNITGVLGHWYQYSRHHHDFEEGCDCLTSEVAEIDADTISVSNCCQLSKINNSTQTCNIGINNARLTNPDTRDGSFQYTREGLNVESHVWIVDTDYENYCIANGCDHVSDDEEREIFYIFSRSREISPAIVKKIDDVLKANNFGRSKIIRQRHEVHLCKSERPPRTHQGHHGRHGRFGRTSTTTEQTETTTTEKTESITTTGKTESITTIGKIE